MTLLKRIALIALSFAAMVACKSTKTLLPNVSGKAGEVIVVMDKDVWEASAGEEVRSLLGSACPYLPQREALYTLVNVAPGAFTDLFKIHRNIVYFNINAQNDTSGVFFRYDVWAKPQIVVQVSAYDDNSAKELVQQNGKLISAAIEQAERDRVINNTLLYEEKSIALKVREVFGGSPHFPMGYKIRKATDDFIWIADDKQYVYQDVLIYKYKAEKDHPFTSDNIISHRNEVMKNNVPGMVENSYMTTSEFFPPMIEYQKYKGRHFVQTRGMWEVKNDFMGGPFVSHSFYSPDGEDIIVAEAFVYAPRYDKRQYLRQVESLLYSWEWVGKDEEKDKANSK